MDDFEFEMTFFDINSNKAMVFVTKMGGGTIGKSYDGSWKVLILGPHGATETMDMRSGTPKSHFDVAVLAYNFYLGDHEES